MRTMLKHICLFLSLVIWAVPGLRSQVKITNPDKLIIFFQGGGSSSGILMEATSDSLLLLGDKGKQWIPYSKLKTVILRGKTKTGKGLGYGAILGTYASILLIATEGRGETEQFLNSGWVGSSLGIVISALPGMLIGGGIGYLIDPGSQGEDVVFDFQAGDHDQTEQFQKIRTTDPEPSLHLSVYGGPISSRSTDVSNFNQQYGVTNGNFNWMRRVQITYSALAELNVGAALLWFGEQKGVGTYWYSTPSPNVSEYGNSNQNLDALGYFAVVQLRPFHRFLSDDWDILVGGGIGPSSIHYQIDYNWSQSVYDPITFQGTYTSGSGSQIISERPITGFLAGEIDYHLYTGLSFGFSVDHVFGPTRRIEGIPMVNIGPRTLKFGNTCVGFGIGLHF